jgi:replication initiation protein RepC
LLQILDTAAEQGLSDPTWQALEGEGRALAKVLRTVERAEEMEIGVASLERRQREARERLEMQLAPPVQIVPEAVDSDPKGPENRPHQYNYKTPSNSLEDVIASEESKSGAAPSVSHVTLPVRPREGQERQGAQVERTDSGTVMRLKPDELVRLAPRLRPYLHTASPSWPDIVEAADWLRHDLSVSKPLWGDACLTMGREKAAIALAIVSAKPAEHFTASAGSYFHGMVKRAEAGTLNLNRTVWGLRNNGQAKPAAKGRAH